MDRETILRIGKTIGDKIGIDNFVDNIQGRTTLTFPLNLTYDSLYIRAAQCFYDDLSKVFTCLILGVQNLNSGEMQCMNNILQTFTEAQPAKFIVGATRTIYSMYTTQLLSVTSVIGRAKSQAPLVINRPIKEILEVLRDTQSSISTRFCIYLKGPWGIEIVSLNNSFKLEVTYRSDMDQQLYTSKVRITNNLVSAQGLRLPKHVESKIITVYTAMLKSHTQLDLT